MKLLSISATILGILFLIVAYVYFVTPANHLPSFLPGFDVSVNKTHFKHGIGAVIIALGLFAFAWFQSGKKSTEEKK